MASENLTRRRYEIVFDEQVSFHFAAIARRDHSLILDTIEQKLTYDPAVATRNRKPMRIPNAVNANWELRCGMNNRYRVFYDVDVENGYVVVLAIGSKAGSTLMIGREELEL